MRVCVVSWKEQMSCSLCGYGRYSTTRFESSSAVNNTYITYKAVHACMCGIMEGTNVMFVVMVGISPPDLKVTVQSNTRILHGRQYMRVCVVSWKEQMSCSLCGYGR